MKFILCLSLALSCAAPIRSQDLPPGASKVEVPEGTKFVVELLSSVSSDKAREGDVIEFLVAESVEVGGRVAIKKGAAAAARVVRAKKSSSWGRAGELGWAMEYVVAADGSRLPFSMESSARGESKGGTVATSIALTGVMIGFPAATLWGMKKGKAAVIPAGRRFKARVGAPPRTAGGGS